MAKGALFILGGSTYYSLLLLQSLKQFGLSQQFSRITLFARNQQRLELVVECGKQLLEGDCQLDYSLDINQCLQPEYTLIFNQIRFGGMSSRDRDEKQALACGLAADETIGIVGISNAIRTIKGMGAYLDVISQKSGDFQLVNFTNPCSILTQYIHQHYQIPVLGICDYPQVMRQTIAKELALPMEDIELGYAGLNHFAFIYSVTAGGQEYLPQLLQRELPFKPKSNRYFGNLLNVSWRYVFEQHQVHQQQAAGTNRAAQLLAIESQLDDLMAQECMQASAYLDVLGKRSCDWFNLAVSPLFQALLADEPSSQIVNTAVDFHGFAPGSVMEVVCQLDRQNLSYQPLPQAIESCPEFHLLQQMKSSERLLLQAILQDSKEGIFQAGLLNPMLGDLDKIQAYFDGITGYGDQLDDIFQH